MLVWISLFFLIQSAMAVDDTTMEKVMEELNSLKKMFFEQQTKIVSLEEILESITEQNRKLQEEVVRLKAEQIVIKEKMNLTRAKVPDPPTATETAQYIISNIMGKNDTRGRKPTRQFRETRDVLLSRSKRLLSQSQTPSEVGFTAARHQSAVVHENGIIIFETSITNAGSAYNPTSGIFRAPVNGLYVFFFDIECSKTNGDTHVELVRDGARIGVQAYCHGLGDFDNSSTLGVLHLSAGDTVWVRLFGGDNRTFGGKTLFSGFLL